jgi:hypothetical protein
MAKMLQEHKGQLNFATDAWTSPNHKAFIAVTVHFEIDGEPMCMLLDLLEVASSHSGTNLAAVFARILDDFGISEKVSKWTLWTIQQYLLVYTGPGGDMQQCEPQRHHD